MKMFKRITAIVVLVFSLCSIAWGEGNGEVSEKEIQELNKKYEAAKEFISNSIEVYPPNDLIYYEKSSSVFLKKVMHNYKVEGEEYVPYFHYEKNKLKLRERSRQIKSSVETVIIGTYKTDDFSSDINKIEYNVKDGKNLFWCFLADELFLYWHDIFPDNKDKRICIIEYLGLNPEYYETNNSKELKKGKIVLYRIKSTDLMRPAYEPDISKTVTERQVKMSAKQKNVELDINKWAYFNITDEAIRRVKTMMMFGDYVRNQKPVSLCTRLGYTLNYSNLNTKCDINNISEQDIGDYFGLSEFIVLDNSEVEYIMELDMDPSE